MKAPALAVGSVFRCRLSRVPRIFTRPKTRWSGRRRAVRLSGSKHFERVCRLVISATSTNTAEDSSPPRGFMDHAIAENIHAGNAAITGDPSVLAQLASILVGFDTPLDMMPGTR